MASGNAKYGRTAGRRERPLAPSLLRGWADGLVDRYRRQIAKEEQSRLAAQLVRQDYRAAESDATQPQRALGRRSRAVALSDPLEQLWSLPCVHPARRRPGGNAI